MKKQYETYISVDWEETEFTPIFGTITITQE